MRAVVTIIHNFLFFLLLPMDTLARVLMNKDIDTNKVCHIKPLGVTKSATFIVDIDEVLFSDQKADDLGTWKNNGTESTYFSMSANGSVAIAGGKKVKSLDLRTMS